MRSIGRLFLVLAVYFGPYPDAAAQSVTTTLDEPAIVWKFKTSAPIISSPVIDGDAVYIGGLDSSLYSINLTSGQVNWAFETGGEIRSTPLVHSSVVYATGGDGRLRAIDASTGSLKWEFVTGGERKYDFADYYQSSPVIDNDRIYFGSGDGCVYAIKVTDGSLLWKHQTGDVVHATPAFDSTRIYVGSFDGYFYAIDRSTGELAWKFKSVGHYYFPKGEFQGSPVVHGSLVYVGARDFNLYALNREKGFCHWNKAFTRGWALANAVHDTTLYIGTSDDRLLIAARPTSGREYWKTNLNFNIFGKIAVVDTIGYVGTLMGKLYGIDIRTGAIVWIFAADGYEANHLKYFKPDDTFRDDIFEIVKSDEAFIDVEYEIGAFFSTPAVSGEFLVVTSADGTVYCLRR